jgi:hypothetical protein
VRRYAAHGYLIDSAVALALPPAGPELADAPADLVLTRGPVAQVPRSPGPGKLLALLETEEGTHYAFSRNDESLLLRFGGCVEFEADPGLHRVRFHLQPEADEALVGVLASGSLLAVRLLLDGQLVLHASALDVGGQVVAFCGAPGMGKSTLAALLSFAGMPLMTDDVLRVSFGPGRPLAWPGGTEARLRSSAFGLADLAAPAAVRDTADGRRAVAAALVGTRPLPLAAVIVPLPSRDVADPELRRLGKAEALMSLVRFPRVIGWCEEDTMQQQFQLLGELVERVPVAEARIPWGPPFSPGLADAVREMVSVLVGGHDGDGQLH